MKNIAIIPARSGSKGLIDKNIKMMNGKPLVAYTIEAALKSGVFDEVMVSTDSEKYATIAKECGANVPFLRSKENAGDASSTWDMVREVLGCYEENGEKFDTFCVLQPTSPLRDGEDIKNAYNILEDKKGWAVVSVCEVEHSPKWNGMLGDDDSMDGFIKKENMTRRQNHEQYYRLNGAIYIAKTEKFHEDEYFYREGCFAYKMSEEHSVDIDKEIDFVIAETLMKREVG